MNSADAATTNGGTSRRIALLFPVSISWLAVVADGISQYARETGDWIFTTSPPDLLEANETSLTVFGLEDWVGDGAIVLLSDPAEAAFAKSLKFPVVALGSSLRECGLPRIMTDEYAVGTMAAEHFIERGLRNLAYYGIRGPWYSDERKRGFLDRAKKAKIPYEALDHRAVGNPRATWRERRAELAEWLKWLPRPTGILAVHDYRARVLADECFRQGLKVPHDIAILGVDNDPIACEFCQPALSSVSRASRRIGYEAAKLLDRLMAGQAPGEASVVVPPDGIVARRSTDTIAVDDPHVAAAIHFMRDHLSEVFGIERVMTHISVSRRRLHELFQQILGRSPYEFLCHLRVERAKRVLASGEPVKMRKIAVQCGFSSPARLRLVFLRVTGMSPLEFRRLNAPSGASKPGVARKPFSDEDS